VTTSKASDVKYRVTIANNKRFHSGETPSFISIRGLRPVTEMSLQPTPKFSVSACYREKGKYLDDALKLFLPDRRFPRVCL